MLNFVQTVPAVFELLTILGMTLGRTDTGQRTDGRYAINNIDSCVSGKILVRHFFVALFFVRKSSSANIRYCVFFACKNLRLVVLRLRKKIVYANFGIAYLRLR